MNLLPNVLISEVGPRDGLQSVSAIMPTEAKLRWIDAMVASGIREIEVTSFVPAGLLPQMADAAEIVRHALKHPSLTVMALFPNLRGPKPLSLRESTRSRSRSRPVGRTHSPMFERRPRKWWMKSGPSSPCATNWLPMS